MRDWLRPYSENPGMPTEEERGIYCPEGIKIAQWDEELNEPVVTEPWDSDHATWCTVDRFLREMDLFALDAAEAEAALLRDHHNDIIC